ARDLAGLARDRDALEATRAALEHDRAQRIASRTSLDAMRRRQHGTLGSLETALADRAARLAALGKDERSMLGLLEKLRDAIADIPKLIAGTEPFAGQRGKLAWPLAGGVVAAFGSRGSDGRVHDGILIAAKQGTSVGAVAYGRVAYADWLKGYGLLSIVDHGDGWMTLYAHNESLLRDVGEWVVAGDAIATAGASGASDASGVYFELRKDGRPVDPSGWLRKR
ncbi:MAG TPA: peptidoglycan DD-metalloendopeptidase family protein, partial [Candidatus Saccharimonadia bacterium]|nr:peptidoglycan DD-metalloendopeptidase family protein [Candidatus Saccharimonadia bacterium]